MLPTTLTLDGDLDGLLRLSRQAEAYFHQVERQGGPDDVRALQRPVVILEGLSYWAQFCPTNSLCFGGMSQLMSQVYPYKLESNPPKFPGFCSRIIFLLLFLHFTVLMFTIVFTNASAEIIGASAAVTCHPMSGRMTFGQRSHRLRVIR